MGRKRPRSLTLDAGALIAVDKAERRMDVLVRLARERSLPMFVPAGVLAQAWRDGTRQARLSSFLKLPTVRIVDLTGTQARAIGELCGRRGTSDVVDASVVLTARRYGGIVVTSDPDDLLQIDPKLDVERV